MFYSVTFSRCLIGFGSQNFGRARVVGALLITRLDLICCSCVQYVTGEVVGLCAKTPVGRSGLVGADFLHLRRISYRILAHKERKQEASP